MPRDQLIASACAIAWAYIGVAAVLTDTPVLIGPAACGFVLALFCAASLEQVFDEPIEEEGDVLHSPDGLFLAEIPSGK